MSHSAGPSPRYVSLSEVVNDAVRVLRVIWERRFAASSLLTTRALKEKVHSYVMDYRRFHKKRLGLNPLQTEGLFVCSTAMDKMGPFDVVTHRYNREDKLDQEVFSLFPTDGNKKSLSLHQKRVEITPEIMENCQISNGPIVVDLNLEQIFNRDDFDAQDWLIDGSLDVAKNKDDHDENDSSSDLCDDGEYEEITDDSRFLHKGREMATQTICSLDCRHDWYH